MFEQAKKELAEKIAQKTGLEPEEVLELFEIPPRAEFGDLALPCFALAKKLKKNPAEIAKELAEGIELSKTFFSHAEPKGAYLNLFLSYQDFTQELINKIFSEKNRYGSSKEGEGKRIVIDYSSPNIAKPFHIGHLRSTIIGASLVRIFKFLGYEVIGINHLGDWGTQFGIVLLGWKEEGNEERLKEKPIQYLLELYIKYNRLAEEDEGWRQRAREWFRRLEEGDEQAKNLWQRFRDLSLEEFKRVYKRLGVEFDYYWGESFYIAKNEELENIFQKLAQSGLLEKDPETGAELVRFDDEGLPPLLLRKSDGATLYATRDLIGAIYRFEKFQPEEMLYVVGRPQELHFQQLFLLLKKMGYEWASRLKHIKFGHIQGLSTRRGEIVLLEEVLDEAKERAREKIEENIKMGKLSPNVDIDELAEQIGISALIINDFKNRREKDLVFNWEQVLNFEGDTGPYLQYTHARICGILRKAQREISLNTNLSLLSEPESKELIKKLAIFPEIVKKAREEYEPFVICNYLFELTSTFNQFYNRHRVLGSGEYELPRLVLVNSVRQVLANGLKLLGATPLEQM